MYSSRGECPCCGAPAPSRRRARGLDDDAFAKLYAARATPLLELLERLTGDPRVAVELWAETLAHCVLARQRFRGQTPDDAAAWLEAIAYRQLARLRFHGHVEPVSLRRLGLDTPTAHCPVVAASFLAQLLPEHAIGIRNVG
ncbi:MAG: hypothetical protein Q8K79_08810 [Solirubrobacteraceae bacterium]|nr:hypothetical protein [Solirubrobacteraceae bacterium]